MAAWFECGNRTRRRRPIGRKDRGRFLNIKYSGIKAGVVDVYVKIHVVDNKQEWFFGFKTSRISLGKEDIRFLFLPTRFKNFFSGGRGSGRGSGHVKALIYKHKHCIFKRFSALTVHFGGQNGQFNNLIFNFFFKDHFITADMRRQTQTNCD